MKCIVVHSILLLLTASCGQINNPFEKKEEKQPYAPPPIEIVSEQDSPNRIASVLVETTDSAPEIGAFLTAGEGESQTLQLVDVQNPGSPLTVGSAINGVVRKALIHQDLLFVLEWI